MEPENEAYIRTVFGETYSFRRAASTTLLSLALRLVLRLWYSRKPRYATSLMQALVDVAPLYGTVRMPRGEYLLESGLIVKQYSVTIIGNGTVIRMVA